MQFFAINSITITVFLTQKSDKTSFFRRIAVLHTFFEALIPVNLLYIYIFQNSCTVHLFFSILAHFYHPLHLFGNFYQTYPVFFCTNLPCPFNCTLFVYTHTRIYEYFPCVVLHRYVYKIVQKYTFTQTKAKTIKS